MKLNRAMIMEGATGPSGGWNNRQLQLLGVEVPPREGWIERILGAEISAENYRRFLALRGVKKNQQIERLF